MEQDTALRRIEEWIARGNVNAVLKLNNLQLTSISFFIPESVRHISLLNNKLTVLDGSVLPRGLKTLVCDKNYIVLLKNLPEGLTELRCKFNR
jgi:hypothetical protein